MSLRLRVVLAVALVLLLSSAVGIALAGWHARQALHEELAAAMAGGRQTVASAFEDLPRSDHPERDLRQLVATFDGNRHVAAVWRDHGREAAHSRAAPAAPAPAWFADLLVGQLTASRIAVPVEGRGDIVLTPVPAADVGADWVQFTDLLTVLALSIVAGAVLVWITVGRALRPLARMSAAFRRIGAGDYAAVRSEGPSELRRLAQGVNEMSGRLAAVQAHNHALEEQVASLQEEERADLARDLHDEVGPYLFAANVDAAMAVRLIDDGKPAEARAQLAAIQQAVGRIQRLVRDILERLRPTPLVEMGLTAAIEDLVAFWRERQPEIAFDVTLSADESEIGQAARQAIYRLVQEGLANAVKHGAPRRIAVRLAFEGEAVVAQVSDDGAAASPSSDGGLGLIGMRERIEQAGGALSAGPGPAGWSVTARLPRLREAA